MCRYDSTAGLGGTFKNNAGALNMGCVQSPNKAKIFIDAVIRAIAMICKGVPLWGSAEGTEQEVLQVAFGDDWLGCFEAEADVRRAWSIWRGWALAHGMKLGVKQKLKTVVTGLRFMGDECTACDISDPQLETEDGKYVPVMTREEAYKHLGLMLRADGAWSDNWKRLRRRVGEAMAKLGGLRRANIDEFELIGDVLMRGLVAFYVMGSYITRDEAEELEKMYRVRFRQRFGVPPGTAVAQYYDSGRRTPAWAVAAGSFYSTVTSRMQCTLCLPAPSHTLA